MSAPFAPSPKFRDYLRWAKEEAGCKIYEGNVPSSPAGPLRLRKIEAPSGAYVYQMMEDNEVVSHSVVAQMDRRLGLDSPFPKTPEPYE